MKKVLKKDEKKPQKDEKEDTTADVPKEDIKDDQTAQDAEDDNSEQDKKAGACFLPSNRCKFILALVFWGGAWSLAPFLL